MSGSQKMFASVSGAILAHLLVPLLVAAMPRLKSHGPTRNEEAKPRVREVTVRVDDWMARLERERPPEEKPAEPRVPEARPFIGTDLNAPEEAAPKGARFESDRNTSAASRRLPDPSAPQVEGPTL